MVETYLGLGTNLGDRVGNLIEAARRLSELPGSGILRASPIYETEPVGPREQGWYLNAVLALATDLGAVELLHAVKELERAMGRQPSARWGPRLIDVDILIHGATIMASPELTIPHRELWNRRFVLVPLADVLPPGPLRERVAERLDRLASTPIVRPYRGSDAGRWLAANVAS